MFLLQILQCSDYGADGKGKHKSGSSKTMYQKNDVYLQVSYYFEEIWGTSDPSMSKVRRIAHGL